MPQDLDRILAAFEGPDPPRDGRPPGLASVLIGLFEGGAEGPEVLFIRRAEGLRTHPGEISFPGGRVDPGDEGPMDAALREAWEEVGIEPARVERVGHLVDYLTYRGSVVCSYVGRVRGEPPSVPASLDEVSEVFTVPLDRLLDPAAYEARRLDGMAPDRRVHYWHLPPRIMWGITGELTAQFLHRACGWTPPSPARTVADVSGLVPPRGP